MKKVVILRKIHVAIKSFAPPFSSRKKVNILALHLPLYYTKYFDGSAADLLKQ